MGVYPGLQCGLSVARRFGRLNRLNRQQFDRLQSLVEVAPRPRLPLTWLAVGRVLQALIRAASFTAAHDPSPKAAHAGVAIPAPEIIGSGRSSNRRRSLLGQSGQSQPSNAITREPPLD